MINVRPARPDEIDTCIRLSLSRTAGDTHAQLRNARQLRVMLEAQGADVSRQLVAVRDDYPIACCLCVPGAGRTATVFVPPMSSIGADANPGLHTSEGVNEEYGDAIVALLRSLREVHPQWNLRILQSLIMANAHAAGRALGQAEWSFLAELLFMHATVGRAEDVTLPARASWIAYNEHTHDAFLATIETTYQDSADCPQLGGVRDIRDVLVSHKSIGRFDPQYWQLLYIDGTAAGCVLLNPLIEIDPDRHQAVPATTMELVYMGVVPAYRGRKIGSLLVGHALHMARQGGFGRVQLAVDNSNTVACRMYASAGFSVYDRRMAWACWQQGG